ncbi:EAL domain-containing protein [Klebsiella pneumoniae subsp. pneumoniae]|nr:EAL domain-containing protein [Klebsiella pneumoniae subsp. pneumoniae]
MSHINAPTFIDDCLHYQRGFEGKAVEADAGDHGAGAAVAQRGGCGQAQYVTLPRIFHRAGRLWHRLFRAFLSPRLVFDYIKIDQSFVGRITGEAPTSKLLDCVIEMARTLSLRIIAEGVETEAQRDYLNRQNIHLLQGYYFWKPMPYVALVMLLLSKPKARIIEE